MSTPNKLIAQWFVKEQGLKDVYGHSMFVQHGILYSLAFQVLSNKGGHGQTKFYHVMSDGTPSNDSVPIALFADPPVGTKTLLVASNWDARFMTLNDHVGAVLKAAKDSGVNFFWSKLMYGESPDHASNVKMYNQWVKTSVKKAIRGRAKAQEHYAEAKRHAFNAVRYSMTFGVQQPILSNLVNGMPTIIDKKLLSAVTPLLSRWD
jgi:hypothetical protein